MHTGQRRTWLTTSFTSPRVSSKLFSEAFLQSFTFFPTPSYLFFSLLLVFTWAGPRSSDAPLCKAPFFFHWPGWSQSPFPPLLKASSPAFATGFPGPSAGWPAPCLECFKIFFKCYFHLALVLPPGCTACLILKEFVLRGGNLLFSSYLPSYLLSVLWPNLSKKNLACCSLPWDIKKTQKDTISSIFFLTLMHSSIKQFCFQGLVNYIIAHMSPKNTYGHLQLFSYLKTHCCGMNVPTVSGEPSTCMSGAFLLDNAVISKRMWVVNILFVQCN